MADDTMGKVLARIDATTYRAGGVLRRMLEVAIDGIGPLPSARHSAGKHYARHQGDFNAAIDGIITGHVALAGAQGFVTNVGGLAVLPVSLPANITGVATVQTRMIAAIAHLHGYDLADNRVRTAIVLCLLGGEEVARRIHNGVIPTSPMAIATAPMFDPELDRRVAKEVATTLLTRVGGKGLALTVTKRVPIIGGGVGAVVDGWSTRFIGRYARGELRNRRRTAQ